MEVRTVSAEHVSSYEEFRAVLNGSHEPLVLKGLQIERLDTFTVAALASELGAFQVPTKIDQGEGRRQNPAYIIADQGEHKVIAADVMPWQRPPNLSFGELTEEIASGSGLYLSIRSGNGTCRYAGGVVCYDGDVSDDLLRGLIARVPAPPLLSDENFTTVIWVGSQGKNFGLHSDMLAEQFVVQNEGVKEVFLLLPEDASLVAPFPFLSSHKFYKSAHSTVDRLPRKVAAGCLRSLLHPGDVLYLPPFWWHEFRTVSEGVSLSTTFRFHLEDNKKLFASIDGIYSVCRNARDRGSDRLAKHLVSFFACGLGVKRRRQQPSALCVALFVAGALAGYIFGRRSR